MKKEKILELLKNLPCLNHMAFHALAVKCYKEDHSIPTCLENLLKKMDLVQEDGGISDNVKSIVLVVTSFSVDESGGHKIDFSFEFECPKCKKTNVSLFEWLSDTFYCQDCNHQFIRCSKCKGTNVKSVEFFDYIKQCEDCGKEVITGKHN